MAATIAQGVTIANVSPVEVASVIFSTNTFPHATKSITISGGGGAPREKANLDFTNLTVAASQSRKFPRKKKAAFTATVLETDFAFLLQLYILMQQPIQALFQTADAKFYSFIKNGTTNALQVYGSATGTNLGVLGWEFVIHDDARYVTITFDTELTLAEWNKMVSSNAAALTGVAVSMKSAGVQANAVGGQASFVTPGWNTGAPATLTNTGGTAQIGIIRTGQLSIKSEGKINYNDNMKYYDRLLVSGKFTFDGVSLNDLLSQLGSSLEKCTLVLNTYGAETIKIAGLSLNDDEKLGDDDMGLYVNIDGHVIVNPNDAAVAPLPNIDIGQNLATEFALNLVNY